MVDITELDNGIRLVTEQIPQARSVAMGIWVRTGAVNETGDNAGISHLIEHMTFKGTSTRSARQLAEDVDRIGGQTNAFTGKEATCYYIKTLESEMEAGLSILLDMFMDSIFDAEELEREKKVIYEEMKMIKDTPDEDAQDTICELVFDGAPLGHSIIGYEDVLAKIDRDALFAYRDAQYTGDSIVVSAAGRFDEAKLRSMIENGLTGLRATKQKIEPDAGSGIPRRKIKVKDIEQSHICLGTGGVPIDSRRVYPYMVVNNIMGGTMSSRLFQHVRERKGLAYSVYSSNSSFAGGGYYNIYAGVAHEKVEETIDAIIEELNLLKRDGVTQDELAMAKEQIKSSYIFGQESTNARMFSNGRYVTLMDRVPGDEEILAAIDAVSFDDLEPVIDHLTDISSYSLVVIGRRDLDPDELIRF